jgi:hypothetical protein
MKRTLIYNKKSSKTQNLISYIHGCPHNYCSLQNQVGAGNTPLAPMDRSIDITQTIAPVFH